MTCPQRPIPTVRDQSVFAKAVHLNHGDDDESGLFMYRTADTVQLSVEPLTLVTQ